MKVNFGCQMMHVARRFADREALVNIERGRRYSLMDFHLLTNKIANMLMDRFDLRRGDKYLNILENDNISLVHLLTIFKGEATCAWTNYRDSIDEHLWQIDWAKPKLVLLELPLLDKYYEPLRSRGIEIICMDPPSEEREGVHFFWDLLEGASDAETGVEHDRNRDVLLFRFTGGTTGKGKCAMYTIENWEANRLFSHTHPERYCYPETRFFHLGPMSHASGLFFLAPLFMGSCQLTQNLPDLEQFCANIQAEKVTSTLLVPTVLYRLLELEESGKYDLSSLITVYYGAAPMNPDKLKKLQAKFGNIFVQVYGSTEHPAVTTALGKEDHIVEKEEDEGRLASCGRVTRRDPGILQQPGSHGSRNRGRLVEVRGHGNHGREGVRVHRGPEEGHDHHGRLQRLCHRGRKRLVLSSGGVHGGCCRHPPPGLGGSRARGGRVATGGDPGALRLDRPRKGRDRAIQGAEIDHLRGRAPDERGRQGAPQEGPGEVLEGGTTQG